VPLGIRFKFIKTLAHYLLDGGLQSLVSATSDHYHNWFFSFAFEPNQLTSVMMFTRGFAHKSEILQVPLAQINHPVPECLV
jgi:hypothetical protein